jgi:hypothetical protein
MEIERALKEEIIRVHMTTLFAIAGALEKSKTDQRFTPEEQEVFAKCEEMINTARQCLFEIQ